MICSVWLWMGGLLHRQVLGDMWFSLVLVEIGSRVVICRYLWKFVEDNTFMVVTWKEQGLERCPLLCFLDISRSVNTAADIRFYVQSSI